MTRRVGVVVAVVALAACLATFYVLRRDDPHRGRDVVTIISRGGIESQREFHRGYHPFDAGFAALPDTMPDGSPQENLGCRGNGWEVIYAGGEHRFFDTCQGLPPVLYRASCLLGEAAQADIAKAGGMPVAPDDCRAPTPASG